MFPIRDVVPTRVFPWVTFLLLTVMAVLFAYTKQRAASGELWPWIDAVGVVPGAFSWPAVFTAPLVHAGWTAAVGSGLALWLFGPALEDRLGHGRFALLLVAAVVVSSRATARMLPGLLVPMVGSTGLVAAVAAGYLRLFPQSRVLTLVPLPVYLDAIELPAFFFAGVWVASQVLGAGGMPAAPPTVAGAVLWQVLAGAATGLVGARVLRRRDRLRPAWWDRG